MTLSRRVRKLEVVAPPARPRRSLPTDPVTFARAYLAGEFTAGDIDPTSPDHASWVCRLGVFLATLEPEHQEWLRTQRRLDPRAYPGELLLPATDDEVLAALDEVMRRADGRVVRRRGS